MFERKISLLVVGLLLGFFVMAQSRSFESANELLLRDSQSNIFQEIKIIREKNKDLNEEVKELELALIQLADQNSALGVIEEQIQKYQKLTGDFSIFGPGITITLDGEVTTPWVIDLINQLLAVGSEAVDINGIRITNETSGFDTLPQGQILINGSILTTPYVVNAIGESSTLIAQLEIPGGFFDRLLGTFPKLKVEVTEKAIIQMN